MAAERGRLQRSVLKPSHPADADFSVSPFLQGMVAEGLAVTQAREHTALLAKWGAHDVDGLDPRRAAAIGLQPAVKKIGHATSSQKLPKHLDHPGSLARFLRRTAELLLQSSGHWKAIEVNTRETHEHYRELLMTTRVNEEAYRTAADIVGKILERPGLLSVWENSCPGLLRSKTRELELQSEGTPVYLETLKEKTRIELVYDAVAALKKIEHERPIRREDIQLKYEAIAERASAEQAKILSQEGALAKELDAIGDGSETIAVYEGALEASIGTDALTLREQQLLACPLQLFSMAHLELLDLACNRISELPDEVSELTQLKKLYLDSNELTTLPHTLTRLSTTLTLLGVANNPLDDTLMQQYLCGLPALLAYLKATRPRRSSASMSSRMSSASMYGGAAFDLFNTALPHYEPTAGLGSTYRGATAASM